MKRILLVLLAVTQLTACNKQSQQPKTEEKPVAVPAFSADSAYLYVKKQVDFGPRVPNSKAHQGCAAYLAAELKRLGAEVIEQRAELTAFDGTKLKSVNIIGSYNPKAEARVLLFAHWDSRPWADNDPEPRNRKKPVMGANDGASGVGVLLEMARLIGKQAPSIGVDIAFFDAEDYGQTGGSEEDSWCLGTQYWASHPHVPGYTARYGILLDMVGASRATFSREQTSEYFASSVVSKVWSQAASLGFAQFFIDEKGGAITDDHLYVNRLAGIPSIDIIHYDPNSGSGFDSHWHTTHDTMDNIDKATLNAVGTTLMHVIYNEK